MGAADGTRTGGVARNPELYFRQIGVGPMANFVYLIGSTVTREAVLVDPAWDVEALLDVAAQDDMRVVGALVTHTHPDHVGGVFRETRIEGVADLLERRKVKVYVHKAEAEFLPGLGSELVKTDEHTRLELGRVAVEFIHTPGHTPGSQCFRVHDRLVSGDTLFIGACGRADLPGSNPGDLYHSLTQKLMRLEEDLLVFPGHDYAEEATHSTIGQEKSGNPYCRFPSKSAFLAAMGFPGA
ncbi:MAG: MBL fold metallo-hydrolase [Deltaproteobacteria bacterium]|nr:MBL fold metallo-hydrolase [Deltaproteobacteria bacterium]